MHQASVPHRQALADVEADVCFLEVEVILHNPFQNLTKPEWFLWSLSVVTIIASFMISGGFFVLTLIASLFGMTALIFLAKGDVWGQILTVLFSVLYAMISLRFRYYGEMITYLGMTAPIAALSIITWLRHPYAGTTEVKVHQMNRQQTVWLIIGSTVVTIVFYFILDAFGTSNLLISTISITTSFLASCLMLFRSPKYALAYAANDLVLIILWILAAMDDRSYLPMIACFVMFLINDLYGYVNWIRMGKRQKLYQAR